jgi:hypothetical protein
MDATRYLVVSGLNRAALSLKKRMQKLIDVVPVMNFFSRK